MLKYETEQDGYLVPLDRECLNDAPKHPSDKAPPSTTDYGWRVHQFDGIDY